MNNMLSLHNERCKNFDDNEMNIEKKRKELQNLINEKIKTSKIKSKIKRTTK